MAITETRVLPPEFIEAAGKTYLGDLATATGQFKTADLTKVFGPQFVAAQDPHQTCLLYTSPSPRDRTRSRMPSSA